jgi:hypothetical protein
LAGEKVVDDGFKSITLDIGLAIGAAKGAEILDDEVDGLALLDGIGGDNRGASHPPRSRVFRRPFIVRFCSWRGHVRVGP